MEGTEPLAYPERRSGIGRRNVALEALEHATALNTYITALDLTSEAVMICDRAGTIVYANRAAEALLLAGSSENARDAHGASPTANLAGRAVLRLLTPGSRRTLLRVIVRQLHEQQVWRGQLSVQHGGVQRELLVALRAAGPHGNRTHHFCVTARAADSGRRPSLRGVADLNAGILSTVGRVAGEIAHDFNNQIAVVLNYSFILLRRLPETSPLRSHVSELQSAAWRASQVAQELLGFAGCRASESDELDINALLQDMQPLFAHALRSVPLIEQRLADDLWRVRARRAHLEWLLVELSARMREQLGPIERFCVFTRNAETAGTPERSVVLGVEASPRGSANGRSPLEAASSTETSRLCSGSSGLRAAELTLSHAGAELTLQELADGGLRYLVRLPACRPF